MAALLSTLPQLTRRPPAGPRLAPLPPGARARVPCPWDVGGGVGSAGAGANSSTRPKLTRRDDAAAALLLLLLLLAGGDPVAAVGSMTDSPNDTLRIANTRPRASLD